MTEIPQYLCLSCCHPLYSSLWRAPPATLKTHRKAGIVAHLQTQKNIINRTKVYPTISLALFLLQSLQKKMGKRKWGLGKGRTRKYFEKE